MDQAATLRKMMAIREAAEKRKKTAASEPPLFVTFTSGGNGMGKSALVSQIAWLMANDGKDVALIDGGSGFSSSHILGERALPGLFSIRGEDESEWIRASAQAREKSSDLVFVDTTSDVSADSAAAPVPEGLTLLVLDGGPGSAEDAAHWLRMLRRKRGIRRAGIAVNRVTAAEARQVFKKLGEVLRIGDLKLDYLGHVPQDEKLRKAVLGRKILVNLYPGAPSVPCLRLIARRLGIWRGEIGFDGRRGQG